MINKIVRILSTIYVILISVILPLYMEEGYFMLGEAKGRMYLLITGGYVVITLLLAFLQSLLIKTYNYQWELWIKAFLLTGVATFLFSIGKKTAFFGLEGWRFGFLTCELMVLSGYILSKGLELDEFVVSAIFATPFLSYVLGILERFGIDFIDIYGKNESFLATLGNINWYTGFLSIFVPLGVGLGYLQKKWTKAFIACSINSVIGLMALLLQGADSGLLIILATYLVLLFFSLSTRENFYKFLMQLFVLGLAMEIVDILMMNFGAQYTYDNNYLLSICTGHIGLVLIVFSLIIYRVVAFCDERNIYWNEKIIKRSFAGSVSVGVLILAVFCAARGIRYDFGNGRMFIWQISTDIFLNLSPWQKMFGVGQDCFFSYAYHNPMWAEALLNVLSGDRLTNAHCELLTILIERGIAGAVTYYGFIGYSFYILIKKERTKVICSLPIAAYLLNSLVSFSTTISTTYLFALIGVGIFLKSDQELE